MPKTIVTPFEKGGKLRDVPVMDNAIWKDGYMWLQANGEDYLKCVELALTQDFSPEEIRSYVQRQTGDRMIALRCEHAARHLEKWEDRLG